MKLVHTFAAAQAAVAGRVGLVPTMGFFHEGHLSLMEAAAGECDTVLVSLFVNPLQFGPGEDLDRYPRDLDRDAALAEAAGADVLLAPGLADMYPDYPSTRVSVDALSRTLEGRSRPGHFEGVATVVAKLFAGLAPDRAYFGRKDAQQLAVVRRLVRDLSFPLEVVGCPIVREPDGLALSSRNVFLSEAERRSALALYGSLRLAIEAVEAGERSGPALDALVGAVLELEPGVEPDYAELNDAVDVVNLIRLDRPAFLAVAARVGTTRLIDNVHFDVATDGTVTADHGVLLSRPSLLAGGG